MKTFTFESKLWLPRKLDEVFPFFTDAFNLGEITPPWLQFRVASPAPVRMQVGTEIDYRLKLRGIPMSWRSRITAWDPPYRFVDEQIAGPYRFWVHEHKFKEIGGHTLCEDHVEYGVFGGEIINRLLVRRDVQTIFRYRSERLQEIFQKLPTEESGQIAKMKMVPAGNLQNLHALQHQKGYA